MNLLFRVCNKLASRNANWVFRPVLQTPPVPCDPVSDTVLYTLLDHRNYCGYILGAKSFLRFCPSVRIVVQSDGSLSERAANHIRAHLPGAMILDRQSSLDQIRKRATPELLRALPDLSRCHVLLALKLLNVVHGFPKQKLILFDSDLVFLREPPFVSDWIQGKREGCFYSDGGSRLAHSFHAIGFEFPKVDVKNFNSGLIGFRNTVNEERLVEIISKIRRFDPRLFDDWEIEQAIWSVLFNDFSEPVNLDDVEHDYVASGYWPYNRIRHSVMAHFVGSVRFRNLSYVRLARQVVRQLKTGQAPSASLAVR